jgi:hypothetical protein
VASAWSRAYFGTALFVANLLVALLLINVVLHFALPREPEATARRIAPGTAAYERAVRNMAGHPSVRDKAPFFPRLAAEDLAALALETWVLRGYRYEPWTQFREGPYRGRFVTVDERGIRSDPSGVPWPPDERSANVFVFGGSTIFGYGLPDDETVPHHLERYLARRAHGPVRVYNFAAGYYFSTQERVLFERLVGGGARPSLAIFIDGLNDFYNVSDQPEFTSRLEALWGGVERSTDAGLGEALRGLPLARAARLVRDRLLPAKQGGTAPVRALPPPPPPPDAPEVLVERVLRRFQDNRRRSEAVAAAFEIPVVIAWQPVPTYGYDLRHHAFAPRDFGPHERSRLGYPKAAALYRSGAFGPRVAWCADIQERLREALYIDTVHYTPRMARRVARCVAKAVSHRGLLAGRGA